ncbi:VOC family protein [Streptomyces cavernicola]|uniref:VOC family protein n=1 Tax=Streptomyces cavernicola TaxID=3043613 RepID=A0ABT6SEB8_9ACTN|nr:VOC family protein [Streptomyces sp. B-S-A6]MDI3406027.1 VOC family protein [Streptomyces sp. B-S-A6]
MTAFADGAPCWVDAMFPDIGAAKEFYGELLGWTFDEGSPEFGGYTQAHSNGKAVAAVVPQLPEMAGQPAAWNFYFASSDVAATAERITANGGKLLMEPMAVGEFGTMVTAQDPSGVHFSVWQAGQHEGFAKTGEPGSFCWAEVFTRDAAAADAFFPAVFDFGVKRIVDDAMDFRLWEVDGQPVMGRFKMTDDVPAEAPSYISVYFGVEDCDEAVATVQRLGGRLYFGPMTMAFGRFAVVADPQGAAFAVIDTATTEGEPPQLADPES